MSASINNKRPYESGSDVLSSSNNSRSFVNTGSNDDVVVDDDDDDDDDDDIVRREEKPLEAYMERISEVEIAKRTKYIKDRLDSMTDEQLTRFEFFVRSHLSRSKVKDILQQTIGTKGVITDEISIIVCSIVKLFIGELMEESLDVMREQAQMNSNSTDDDASKVSVDNVTTAHINEAYRRMQVSGQILTNSDRSYMFNTDSLVMFNDDVFDFIPILMPMMIDEEMKQVNLQSSNKINDDDNDVDDD